MTSLLAYLVDALVILALVSTTIAVIGMYRFDEPYLRLHSASMATFAGILPLFIALLVVGDAMMVSRATVAVFFLFVVLPVSVHTIGRARYLRNGDGASSGRD